MLLSSYRFGVDFASHGSLTTFPGSTISTGDFLTFAGDTSDVNGVDYVGVVLFYWDGSAAHFWDGTAWILTYTPFVSTLNFPGASTTSWSVTFPGPTVMPEGGTTVLYSQVVVKDHLNNYTTIIDVTGFGHSSVHTLVLDHSSKVRITTAPSATISTGQSVTFTGQAADIEGVTLVQQVWVWWDGTVDKYFNRVSNTWTTTWGENVVNYATLTDSGDSLTEWTVTCNTPTLIPSGGTVLSKILVGDTVPNYTIISDSVTTHTFSGDHNMYISLSTQPPASFSLGSTVGYTGVASDGDGVQWCSMSIYYNDGSALYFWNGTAWSTTYTDVNTAVINPGSGVSTYSISRSAPTIMPPGGITTVGCQIAVFDVNSAYSYLQTSHTLTVI